MLSASASSGPLLPWRLVVLISGSESFPRLSPFGYLVALQRSQRPAGLLDLLSTAYWSGDGESPSSASLSVW